MRIRSMVGPLALAGALTAVACGGGGGGGEAPPPLTSTLGPLGSNAQLYYDNGGGITDSTRLVVTDEEAYQEVWARATSQQTSPPAPPPIDFEEQMVVVVGAGEMTPDDRIQVDSVGVRRQRDSEGEMEDHFVVVVRTTEGCQRFDLPAFPLQIVRVRAFEGPVAFVERRVKEECGDVDRHDASAPAGV